MKGRLDGIGRFSLEILSRIVRAHPEHEFIFLFDRPFDSSFLFADNVTPVVLGPPARHPFLFVAWFEFSVKNWLRKNKPDLFLSPDGYLSLGTKVPSLTVIHDLNFEHYPDDLPWLVRSYYRYFFPKFAAKARRIATVSHFSATDISKTYRVDPGVIDVVYNGVNEIFQKATVADIGRFKELYTGGAPYFVTVGSIHPRKNVVRTIQAFTWFRQKFPEQTAKLVLIGDTYWWNREMKSALESSEFKQDIIFAGRLDDAAMNIAVSGALALLYISYFEGFGIPMIEAMRCGTPVLGANATAIPEIAGKAAYYVDPFSVADISYGLHRLATDEAERERLIALGYEQARLYSWDRSAALLWESIEKALN
ncbi:MAG: glycosyltransferase family 1 protein [Bacteroidota bacterium]